jgi:hypothetical protein
MRDSAAAGRIASMPETGQLQPERIALIRDGLIK